MTDFSSKDLIKATKPEGNEKGNSFYLSSRTRALKGICANKEFGKFESKETFHSAVVKKLRNAGFQIIVGDDGVTRFAW